MPCLLSCLNKHVELTADRMCQKGNVATCNNEVFGKMKCNGYSQGSGKLE